MYVIIGVISPYTVNGIYCSFFDFIASDVVDFCFNIIVMKSNWIFIGLRLVFLFDLIKHNLNDCVIILIF